MKKLILLSATLLLSVVAFSQTQQGYVKTKGRMVNGKLVPGQGLKGATISIKGRTLLSNSRDTIPIGFCEKERLSISGCGSLPENLQILKQSPLHRDGIT